MSQKPGRNDPCYCGSGKKYKKCHMQIDQAAEREVRSLKDAAHFLREELFAYAQTEAFADDFAQALPIFWNNLYDGDNADEMAQGELRIFGDWFVFDYELSDGSRVIERYRDERGDNLTPDQLSTLEKWLEVGPLSGYELVGYEGQTLQVREFMTGDGYEVFEPAGRGAMSEGDIILAHIAPVLDHLEFTTDVPYIPAAEVEGLLAMMTVAREEFLESNPDGDQAAFLRKHNYLLAKHALEQAEKVGRPPVARLDPARADRMPAQTVRRYVRR